MLVAGRNAFQRGQSRPDVLVGGAEISAVAFGGGHQAVDMGPPNGIFEPRLALKRGPPHADSLRRRSGAQPGLPETEQDLPDEARTGTLRRSESRLKELSGLPRGVSSKGLAAGCEHRLGRPARIDRWPGRQEMGGQPDHIAGPFQRFGKAEMELLAPGAGDLLVGHLVNQRVLEAVGDLGPHRPLDNQPGPDQSPEGGDQIYVRLYYPGQDGAGGAFPSHRDQGAHAARLATALPGDRRSHPG